MYGLDKTWQWYWQENLATPTGRHRFTDLYSDPNEWVKSPLISKSGSNIHTVLSEELRQTVSPTVLPSGVILFILTPPTSLYYMWTLYLPLSLAAWFFLLPTLQAVCCVCRGCFLHRSSFLLPSHLTIYCFLKVHQPPFFRAVQRRITQILVLSERQHFKPCVSGKIYQTTE